MKKLLVILMLLATFGAMAQDYTLTTNGECSGNCQGTVTVVVNDPLGASSISLAATNTMFPVNLGNSWQYTFTNVCQGTYAFNLTMPNGTSYSQNVTLSDPTPIVVTWSASPGTCEPGDYIDMTVTGAAMPYFVQFNQNGNTVDSTQLVSGDGWFTVTDATGCAIGYDFVIPSALEGTVTLSTCQGQQVVYQGTPYWVGQYWLTGGVDPATGCDSTIHLIVDEIPSGAWVNTAMMTCTFTTLEIMGAPVGSTYNWYAQSNPWTIMEPTNQQFVTVNTYPTLFDQIFGVVTTPDGCVDTLGPAFVMGMQLNVQIVPTLPCGDVLTAQVLPGFGTPPYTYSWNGMTGNEQITAADNNWYNVYVVDVQGCTGFANYTPIITMNVQGGNCGEPATMIVTSPNQPITYSWEFQGNVIGTDATTDVNETGTYTAQMTDGAGCDISMPLNFFTGPDVHVYHCGDKLIALVDAEGIVVNSFNWFGLDPGACTDCYVTDYPSNINNVGYWVFWHDPAMGNSWECEVGPGEVAAMIQEGCPATIQGNVFYDENMDCIYDSGTDEPRPQAIIKAEGQNGGVYYAYAQPDGSYNIAVEPDTYNVSVPTFQLLELPCNPSVGVASDSGDIDIVNLGFEKLADCSNLEVNIGATLLRRCMGGYYSVQYQNTGTDTAYASYLVVNLDPLAVPSWASMPYTVQPDGGLRFELGDVAPWALNYILINVNVSCDAELGQSLCSEAHIFPDTVCMPPLPNWDGSQLFISGSCDVDSVRFMLQNIGSGDMMPPPVPYYVIEDQIILLEQSGTVSLPSQAFIEKAFPKNGSTWTITAEQTPGFPYPNLPAATIEGCVDDASPFSIGFVNQYPLGDQEPYFDIDCSTVIGSFDPNDKTAQPIGYASEHFITPETPINYQIRFQNTGTDTAFTIVVRDTLSPHLDVTSFKEGAASHPHRVDILGNGELVFTFQPIALPDSNVNEVASHGFVNFTITPRADAPLGTVISNSAAIYFDYNEPVITNQTMHTLARNFVTVGTEEVHAETRFTAFPNPTDSYLTVRTDATEHGNYNISITDLLGRRAIEGNFTGNQTTLDLSKLPKGIYILEVRRDASRLYSARITVK